MGSERFCLINNGSHIGISSIGRAYQSAFESFGINLTCLDFRSFPKMHNDTINMTIKAHLVSRSYTHIIFIQPTYLYADTYHFLMGLKKQTSTKFYSIHTEDPYSVSPMLQMSGLFDLLFTNEKVCAERYANQRFRYLPVAHNHYRQYRKMGVKEYDASMICSYYGNRVKVYEQLKKMDLRKFIAGNIAWLAGEGVNIDLTGFSQPPGLMPRHKELEIYSKSCVVLNPHRPVNLPGLYDFTIPNKKCTVMVDEAISPNPRFFDAMCCGAFPLNDISRTECLRIMSEVPDNEPVVEGSERSARDVWVCLPLNADIGFLPEFVSDLKTYHPTWMRDAQKYFLDHHTYLNRAAEFLGVINA